MAAQGIFFLVAGPTAAGKTSLLRRLAATATDLHKDVSVTTRAPREGEVDGQAYHFWDRERFEREAARGAFLEHALVHGRDRYGTLKRGVEERLGRGLDLIKDIDVQGVAQIRKVLPYPRTVAIFVVPPSPERLVARFKARGTEDEAAWKQRQETARRELRRVGEYDYLIFNEVLEEAVEDLRAIRRAEHLRREKQEAEFRRRWKVER